MIKETILKLKKKKGDEDIPIPSYITEGSSGIDLYSANKEDIIIKKGEYKLIPLGIFIEIPKGYEAQLRPRSGLALHHGITILNSPATIDSDYRGELFVILLNLGKEDFTVKRGMRIAQMVIQKIIKASIVEVDTLNDTKRGEGGFGHSGI